MQPHSGLYARSALAVLIATSARAQGTASTPVMSVGPNVEVSKQFATLAHYELWAAGDPDHAGRLLACSTLAHLDLAAQGHHCYVSFDDGKTWSVVLEFDQGVRNSDPVVTYGRG